MKPSLITAAILIFTATQAHADKPATCEQIHDAAEAFMEARQSGVSVTDMMEVAGDDQVIRNMVIGAYSVTEYHTPEYQRRAVREYAEAWYIGCVKRSKE